jgi:hypothetical protein
MTSHNALLGWPTVSSNFTLHTDHDQNLYLEILWPCNSDRWSLWGFRSKPSGMCHVLWRKCSVILILWHCRNFLIHLFAKQTKLVWGISFLRWGFGSKFPSSKWHSLFRLLMRNGRWGACCMTLEGWSDVHSRINNMVVLKSVVQSLPAQSVLDRHFPGMVGLV